MGKLFSTDKAACKIGETPTCPAEKICVENASGRPECIARYVGPTPLVRFPYGPEQNAVCAQGAFSTKAGHIRSDNFYALDFASRPSEHERATVYASHSGTALVYQGCPDGVGPRMSKEEKRAARECGKGFGNHIRLMTSDGLMIVYAHLETIHVQDGQPVEVGDPLGREGRSGGALERGVHFSVHAVPAKGSAVETLAYFRSRPAEIPPTIPFETQYCEPSLKGKCLRRRARMDKMPCGGAQEVLLRADWRK